MRIQAKPEQVLVTAVILILCSALASVSAREGSLTSCNSNTVCQPSRTFQECIRGFCQCSSPVSHFDAKTGTCRLVPDGVCDMNTRGTQGCVENAYCYSEFPGAQKGSCKCNSGYEEDANGQCISVSGYAGMSGLTMGIIAVAAIGVLAVMIFVVVKTRMCSRFKSVDM